MLEIPPLREKIRSDYWMMTFLIMSVLYIIIGTLMYILSEDEQFIAIIILGFFVVSVIGLIARSKIIDNYFTTGMAVKSTIVKINRYGRYPYFKVTYKINYEDFTKKIYISRGGKSREYSEGSTITLLVDQSNPKKAIILSFYE